MACQGLDRRTRTELISVVRGELGDPRELRFFAAAVLEVLIVRSPPRGRAARELLGALGLVGAGDRVRASVLRDGFTARDPDLFLDQLLDLLAANGWARTGVRGRRTTAAGLRRLLALARTPCRLWLTRYLLEPEEVVGWVLEEVRRSRAIPSPFLRDDSQGGGAARRLFRRLPRYEAEILGALARAGEIFWVGPDTPSELFSLVRYPPGTVVLTVRPPGSCLEIEIKRAGRREELPLGVAYRRGGRAVPPSHRLDGGSMGLALNWEANAAAKLGALYRRVHGEKAPVSTAAAIQTILDVPTGAGDRDLHHYFDDPHVFGAGHDAMRRTLEAAWRAFVRERDWKRPEPEDGRALTHEFLVHTKPAQAILAGSSDLRVDLAARYLSSDGAASYFHDVPGSPTGRRARRRLADTLLAELLPPHRPPPGLGVSYDAYVGAALSRRRRRADAVYLDLLRQAARVWGTLLAVRGCSRGESFVGRNVGLRRVWREAEWRVELVFMDHDELTLPPWEQTGLLPWKVLGRMESDDFFLGGLEGGRRCGDSLFELLGRIYRVSPERAREGRSLFREALAGAYRTTLGRLTTEARFEDLFHPDLLARLGDWDDVAALFLRQREDGWRASAAELLRGRGYAPREIPRHLAAMERHAGFLERTAFLYEPPGRAGCASP